MSVSTIASSKRLFLQKLFELELCKRAVLYCLFFLFSGVIYAQDMHWSLIHLNPGYLNPAYTGFAKKKNRITGLYRDQWRSVPVPYSTTNIAYDRNIYDNFESGWRLGVGAQFLYDKAGDGALSTFRPGVSAAVGKYIRQRRQLFQIGINTSYSRKQIDFSKLKFDSQFDGGVFNPDLSSQELISGDKAGYLDLGVGFNFNTLLKEVGNLDAGVAVANLTKPDYTFLSGAVENVQPRLIAYTKANIDLGQSNWTFNPAIYFQNQSKAQETLLQAIFGVKIGRDNEGFKNTELQFGPGYRIGDAVVAYAGLQWKDLKVGFAFDGNVSNLKTATNGRGAYELALNYEWERKKKEEEPELFDFPEEEEPVEEEIIEEPEIPVPDTEFVPEFAEEDKTEDLEESVRLRAAVQLFFANDRPNPRTRDTTTTLSYDATYEQYIRELGDIVNDTSSGFANHVEKSFNELQTLLGDILTLLEKDKALEIEISGFASPLSNASYNENLTKRRVVSLINYLNGWNNSIFASYLESGQLRILRRPFGDLQADENVSSNPKDKAKSIYSKEAAYERRVELRVTEIR